MTTPYEKIDLGSPSLTRPYSVGKTNTGYQKFDIPGITLGGASTPVTSGYNFNLPASDPSFDSAFNIPAGYGGAGSFSGNNPDASTSGFSLFGNGKDNPGVLIPGLDALAGIMGAYTGYKTLGLAEDQFAFSKGQYNQDFNSQAQVYNTNLEAQEAQRRRQSSAGPEGTAGTPEFEQALASYLQANTIAPSAVG